MEVAGADHVERLEFLDPVPGTDVAEPGVLTEGSQRALGGHVLGRGHVDDRPRRGVLHVEPHRSGGDAAEVVGVDVDVVAPGGLVVEQLPHGVDVVGPPAGAEDTGRVGRVQRPAGVRAPYRGPQHPERLARRPRIAPSAGVDGGQFDGSTPVPVVEPGPVPSGRMDASVEGLDGQAGYVTRHRHRRPGRAGGDPPADVRHEPFVSEQRLEDQAPAPERVGGRHRRPPRRGLAVVAGGDRQDIGAGPEERCQIHHVVVGSARVGPDGLRAPPTRSPRAGIAHRPRADTVPAPERRRARRCVGTARRAPGVHQLRSGGRGGDDGRTFEPDPATEPGRAEWCGMVEAHRERVASGVGPVAGAWNRPRPPR